MSAKQIETIKTTGQLRALLGKALARLEAGDMDPDQAAAMCKVAQSINQSFAEETKAVLAAKEIGALQVGFGHTYIGEADEQKLEKRIESRG
jgi:hypothetical protein